MNKRKPVLTTTLATLAATMFIAAVPAAAQSEAEAGQQENMGREQALRRYEQEMREAEARLEQAAQRVAELSMRQLEGPRRRAFAMAFTGGGPKLGVTIDGDDDSGPVEGVTIRGITPGGAAADAGLQAGDVLTSINGESLSASNSAAANEKLLDFMRGVEAGDKLSIEYLRDGRVASVELEPREVDAQRFVFRAPRAPGAPGAPEAMVAPLAQLAPLPGNYEFFSWRGNAPWRDLEMVTLTEDLGRYFGTDEGLLVVRAPEDNSFQLRDGDVIRAIDGRTPESVQHAVRILSSYQPGEKLKLEIMRDKRRRTLDVEVPDHRSGMLLNPAEAVDRARRMVRVAPRAEVIRPAR